MRETVLRSDNLTNAKIHSKAVHVQHVYLLRAPKVTGVPLVGEA